MTAVEEIKVAGSRPRITIIPVSVTLKRAQRLA